LESCRVHFSKVTEQSITENHISHVPHPFYSPDLAPSDFSLFGHATTSLVGKLFDATEDLLEAITEFLEEIQLSELEIVFGHWIERVRRISEKRRLLSSLSQLYTESSLGTFS
jgi:hypothetical protein